MTQEQIIQNFESVFSKEEQDIVESCIVKGQWDSIPSALDSFIGFQFTPSHEKALQDYLNLRRPLSLGNESEVLQELRRKEREENYRIESPEEEREWQARLDAEMAAKKAKLQEQTGIELPKEEGKDVVIAQDDLSEVELTRNEMKEELTKKGVAFKPNASKAELTALLEAALA